MNDCVIPVSALHKQEGGRAYILLVKQADGAWGKEYYCFARYVNLIDTDENMPQLRLSKI